MVGSRRSALAIRWVLALAFIASVLLNGLHVAREHHHDGPLAHGPAVSDHDDDHEDDHHDHALHDARDHLIAARAASTPSFAPQLAPIALIVVAPEPPAERLHGLTVDEHPLRIPDPLALSPRKPRAPPLG